MTLASYFNEDIECPWHIDCILLVMSFASAMIDTVTVPILHIFVANNTGNLLFLGLGAASIQKIDPTLAYPDRAATALAASWLASFVTGFLIRRFGKRRRLLIFGEFLFESILVFISTILYYTHAVDVEGRTALIMIALLGYVFGAQAVLTKTLGVPTIMVQVVTGAMGDLFSDPKLFASPFKNTARNQRTAFIVVFFLGCLVGGLVLVKVNGELVMLLTGIFKLLSALGFLFVPGKRGTLKDQELAFKPTTPIPQDSKLS